LSQRIAKVLELCDDAKLLPASEPIAGQPGVQRHRDRFAGAEPHVVTLGFIWGLAVQASPWKRTIGRIANQELKSMQVHEDIASRADGDDDTYDLRLTSVIERLVHQFVQGTVPTRRS
jgi:hypothetical protein